MDAAPWGKPALSGAGYSAAELSADEAVLYLLDQRLLPTEERYLAYEDADSVAGAIRDMVVRGAPAIGIAAAYGMALAARSLMDADPAAFLAGMRSAGARLESARPTAVNLPWAVAAMLAAAEAHAEREGAERAAELAERARALHREDVEACRTMGRLGAEHLAERLGPGPRTLLTHCNAGALATGGYGTALGVVRAAAAMGPVAVYACETRPYLQGARLTAWELVQDGIEVTVIADNMVAHCFRQGRIDAVVVGADRIAKSGDVANKIGTYAIACLARHHGIPMFVAAPWSTVDLASPHGSAIPIEERPARELSHLGDRALTPERAAIYNPAFDVTPAELVTAVITERGVVAPADIATLGRAR